MKKRGEVMKIGLSLMSVLVLTVISGFLVSGIGIGFSQIVEIYPGQSSDEFISLQNTPSGNGDLTFTWTIQEGSSAVSFPDGNDFEVGDGEIRQTRMRISVDENTSGGSL